MKEERKKDYGGWGMEYFAVLFFPVLSFLFDLSGERERERADDT